MGRRFLSGAGDASLGLSRFAAAKSSTYDKRARVAKERALNAKKARAQHPATPLCLTSAAAALQVNAYRKLQQRLARLGDAGDAAPAAGGPGGAGGAGEEAEAPSVAPRAPKPKRFNALEATVARRTAAREAEVAAAAAAAAAQAGAEAGRAAAAAARRQAAAGMRKRNARGQPLMKYRVDGILQKLQREASR